MTRKQNRLEKHHAIGFDDISKIDWHLTNLWNCGYKTCIDMPWHFHAKLCRKESKTRKLDWYGRYAAKVNSKGVSTKRKVT